MEIISEYKGANEKVTIKCSHCGKEFNSIARSVINSKHGCPHCKVRESRINKAKEIFIKKLKNTKFTLISYNSWKDIEVKCTECNSIRHTTADNILRFDCKHCAMLKFGKTLTSNTEQFIEKAQILHNNIYDYSKVNYVNCKTPVEIICKKHGSFLQTPLHHLGKEGCPRCNNSKGELEVRNFLIKNNILFKEQYWINNFRVDFYLPEQKMIIEYNGL